MSAKQSLAWLKEGWFLLVSVSGNSCLMPWSVIPVDASDSSDTILDAVRAGKYESIQKV